MKKQGIAVLLVLFFAVTSIRLGMNRVNANNHRDTKYAFVFSGWEAQTNAREKKDDSSCYMKCTIMPSDKTYTAYVYGTNYSDKNTLIDVSRGYHYLFKKGTTRFMRNWVYEENLKYAVIGANRNNLFPFYAEGVWSPDSVPE